MLSHLVLIGIDFKNHRSTGDKNFWFDLLPFFANHFKRITILSIHDCDKTAEFVQAGKCEIKIKYLEPILLKKNNRGAFPRGIAVLEKLLNIKRLRQELKSIDAEHRIDQVHLMDNLGFANRFLNNNNIQMSISVSAMSYHLRKNKYLYESFLKFSYHSSHLTPVPYSRAYKQKMLDLGFEAKNVCHIPWGIDCEKSLLKVQTEQMKPLILWAGFIQQIQKKDFLFAVSIASLAIKKGLHAIFYFAFKPESFENEFKDYHNPSIDIFVTSTSVDQFEEIKKTSNLMFSPVVNPDVILAPPLTWLEMMNNGVPIITTNVPGASEAVVDGETGFIGKDENELVNKLFTAVQLYPKMQNSCKEMIRKNYNISKSANSYLNLWTELAAKRRVS